MLQQRTLRMREKADSELVRQQNRHLVLRALRQNGPQARIELGRLTGLSPASITSISAQLIGEQLVLELPDSAGNGEPVRRGRPMVRLDLNPAIATVLAAKISIDGMELALADFRGQVITRGTASLPTHEADRDVFGKAIAAALAAFLEAEKVPRGSVKHIAVAAQGLADARAGTLVWSPAFRARNIPVCAPVQRKLGVPCSISNDANMIAEGLINLAPQRYSGNSAVIFIGYGVGMGLILNGVVYRGANGVASEFGHMNHIPDGPLCRCGRRGCIEAYAADYGIARSAAGLAQQGPPTEVPVPAAAMARLEEAARLTDGPERLAFDKAGEALGYGIARMVALLAPEHVVLAGPGTRAMALIEPALHQAFAAGVVEELRRNTDLSVVPIDTDMIIKGTIDTMLRMLDQDLLANGQAAGGIPKEHVA